MATKMMLPSKSQTSRHRRRVLEHHVKRRLFMEKLEDRRLLQGVPDWLGTDSFDCGDPGCPLCCGMRQDAEDWNTDDLRQRLGIEAPAYGPQLAPIDVMMLGTSVGWDEPQSERFFLRRELVIIDSRATDFKQLLTTCSGATTAGRRSKPS
jgi:hypothetical protein